MNLKGLIYKASGKISTTKIMGWVTTLCAAISETGNLLVAQHMAIPAGLIVVMKYATIVSGIITVIKLRNAGEK